MTPLLTGSRLRSLLSSNRAADPSHPPEQASGQSQNEHRCDLCAAATPASHRHLVDLEARALRCACRPCALLFDADRAGRYRLVPERRRHLPGFTLDDEDWHSLRLPVEVAFFFHDSAAGRTVACYPSPAGAVESRLDLATWSRVVSANPALARLAPDVEAVLVSRTGAARGAWLVPIDDCYALVGLIRTHWRGLAGGARVWQEISRFFQELPGHHRRQRAGEE